MVTAYGFEFGTMFIEYEGEILYRLRSIPELIEITPEIITGRSAFSDEVFRQAEEFMSGRRKTFDIKYELLGTDFQKRIWRILQSIPYGETATYKEVAALAGNSAASRAVGMANNKNPLFLIVPCHRVIGSGGKLVGYAGGPEMRKALLDMERRNK